MTIPIAELNELVLKALTKYGYSDADAQQIAAVLLYAQLRGNNQGIVKLIGNGIPIDKRESDISIEKETKVSARINGAWRHSMVVAHAGVELAIKKAKEVGVGIVGTHSTQKSSGALGYFARKIADAGFIGYICTNGPDFVTTHGSNEPLFCTNPFAYGIPTDEDDPIVLDMATSAVAYFGLVEAKTAGRSIPEGLAFDKDGNETTDPAAAMDGVLKPFGGYKGAGLALLVEIFGGPLVGAEYTKHFKENSYGHFILAIDPEVIIDDKAQFRKQVSEIVEAVRNAKRLPGVDRIYTPGERGDEMTRNHIESGTIEIEDNLLEGLRKAAE